MQATFWLNHLCCIHCNHSVRRYRCHILDVGATDRMFALFSHWAGVKSILEDRNWSTHSLRTKRNTNPVQLPMPGQYLTLDLMAKLTSIMHSLKLRKWCCLETTDLILLHWSANGLDFWTVLLVCILHKIWWCDEIVFRLTVRWHCCS
jgi:hypothetical protein